MVNFTFDNPFIQKVILFLKKYGIFIAPIFLFLLFMFLLLFSYTRPPKQSLNNIPPSQTPNNNYTSSSPQYISPSPSSEQSSGTGMETDEKAMVMWTNSSFDQNDLSGLNSTQTTLADGSIQYSYSSDNPNRPNIIIVKNGINIFQQTPFTDTPLTDNTNYYGTPDYKATGSKFWGANAVIYIYLSKGIAIVGDPNKNQMFEQMIFQPGTVQQFEQYDTDMIGAPQKL
jgi:hypothetical protein